MGLRCWAGHVSSAYAGFRRVRLLEDLIRLDLTSPGTPDSSIMLSTSRLLTPRSGSSRPAPMHRSLRLSRPAGRGPASAKGGDQCSRARLLVRANGTYPGRVVWEHLGDKEFFAAPSGDRLTHQGFRRAVAVHLCGVDPVIPSTPSRIEATSWAHLARLSAKCHVPWPRAAIFSLERKGLDRAGSILSTTFSKVPAERGNHRSVGWPNSAGGITHRTST